MKIRDVAVVPLGAIPLEEVSDLALAGAAGSTLVVAVGDRAACVVWARIDDGPQGLVWTVEPLPGDTLSSSGASQLEGVASDGAGGILLVAEWPNRAVLVDAPSRSVVGAVDLVLPEAGEFGALGRSWLDAAGSHAEGVLMLRAGHLLIVKEKDPAGLLEFAPRGAAPAGFGPDAWLADGERWKLPAEGPLELVAAWLPDAELAGLCPDLSAVAEGPEGTLLLLSDQGASVARIPGMPPAAKPLEGVISATAGWRLTGLRGKPEGIAVLPDGDVLIACDRKKARGNLFLVPAGSWLVDG